MTTVRRKPEADSVWFDKRLRQHNLYPRQKEALQLYARGLKYEEIAKEMGVEVGTARSYIGAARVTLGADNPPDAVRIAVERGEIEPVDRL